jgi:cytochrome c oxidase cbb3-type subunit 1
VNDAGEFAPADLTRSVARHSLGWLVAANLVGVWMAVVLLWPAVGDLAAPLTYGRWVPLHLDWQLYGWLSLPLVGVLLAWFLDARDLAAGRGALRLWSAALALGGVSWLTGHSSGKLFLEWTGDARPLLPAAMLVLWGVLALATWRRWPILAPRARLARGALLAFLLPVPAALFWAMSAEVYPAANPDSGGATGAALLGSTLGIVTLFLLLPVLLRVPALKSPRRMRVIVALLAANWLVFAAIDHGNVSHHALAVIVALGSLLAWIPLLALAWSGYAWSDAARPWLRAALVWWALLVLSGWLSFLPAISEALKFTHGLVAHAHLAMAGLVTSVNGTLLTTLTRRPAPRGVFATWQIGCALHVAALLALGAVESDHAAELFRGETWTQALLALRLAGGAAMALASVRWLLDYRRP